MCIEKDCKIQPYYNNEGQKKPIYCSAHKKDGMVDVKNKTCLHPECKFKPSYNNEGQQIEITKKKV